jgi:hypothetical protein
LTIFQFIPFFQVKLLGEGADDAGGVFDDVITEMCRELVAPHSDLNLLVLTPNGVNDIGLNRDKYLLNSQLCLKNNSKDRKHLWFLGKLSRKSYLTDLSSVTLEQWFLTF